MGHETRPTLTTTEPNLKVRSFEDPKMVMMLTQQVSNSIQIEFPAYQRKKKIQILTQMIKHLIVTIRNSNINTQYGA